jgi:hypothetical protein
MPRSSKDKEPKKKLSIKCDQAAACREPLYHKTLSIKCDLYQ